MSRSIPAFISSIVRGSGGPFGNNFRWISSDENWPARRTTMFPPASSHSRIDPGAMPSLLRMLAGTETCPCAVTLERASAMALYYHGNAIVLRATHFLEQTPPHHRIYPYEVLYANADSRSVPGCRPARIRRMRHRRPGYRRLGTLYTGIPLQLRPPAGRTTLGGQFERLHRDFRLGPGHHRYQRHQVRPHAGIARRAED